MKILEPRTKTRLIPMLALLMLMVYPVLLLELRRRVLVKKGKRRERGIAERRQSLGRHSLPDARRGKRAMEIARSLQTIRNLGDQPHLRRITLRRLPPTLRTPFPPLTAQPIRNRCHSLWRDFLINYRTVDAGLRRLSFSQAQGIPTRTANLDRALPTSENGVDRAPEPRRGILEENGVNRGLELRRRGILPEVLEGIIECPCRLRR